ncbi:CoA transferase [Arthrobacter sp. FW305-BF8]|uniref:CaiB/BaiF CoA transferase family protein n=1 Tax=Arthrobacter sp. FW305-BF8 TaxID=2879617 RepID=UPI001F1885EE|nr:CoA transferase [Arthrobacter sp. FW305-BF8]UKA55263.1 CoA transferase [Arthrobacter sp. FW305-BF8]
MSSLEGIRVLEFGHVIAGPFAASLLGDHGAEVIKIERPNQGDSLRKMGPQNARGLWFEVSARNKKSVEVDLGSPEGAAFARELVESADVIIENYRPGVMEQFGLGWDDVHAINPRAVMLRISGFGQTGPYSARPGFGKISEAFSGATNLTGYTDGPPVHPGYSHGDLVTGVFGAFGVMLALHERNTSGLGQMIDLPLYEGLFRMIDWQVPFLDVLGIDSTRAGASFPFAGGFITEILPTIDGKFVVVSAATGKHVGNVVDFLQEGGHLEVKGEGDIPVSVIKDALGAWLGTQNSDEAVASLKSVGVIAEKVSKPSDITKDPHIAARHNLVPVESEEYGKFTVPAPVPRLSRTPGQVRSLGPKLGAHNQLLNAPTTKIVGPDSSLALSVGVVEAG